MSSEVKKMMEADVQGHCLIMSVAVNKRMLCPRRRKIINNIRQRSRMRLKLYIVITTKEQDNFQVGVSCQSEIGAGVICLRRRNSRNLRRKHWRTKLIMKLGVTSMKQWSCRINEQGSDGEDVSQED